MENDILINGALKEREILEFRAGGNSYGVNVSDIREILPYNKKPTPVPNSHPFIEGIIMPRDFIISIIDFTKSFKLSSTDELRHEMLIVTGINDLNIAFHVDSVKGIHRVMNTDITKPGKKLTTSIKDVVTGIIEREDRKIEVIELRKIISEINPEVSLG
jgi:two-component system chemotaxis response regulator CheV